MESHGIGTGDRGQGTGGKRKTLSVPRTIKEEVIQYCQSRWPKEACGILAANKRSEIPGREIVQMYTMTNVEDSPVGYSMDPREQLQLEKTMRQRGQKLAGIFHSHTASEAYPSPVDVAHAISPDISYVLVSLKKREAPDFKSYRIDGSVVTEEDVWFGRR